MSEIKNEVYEGLMQLQWILHRQQLQDFGGRRTSRNPRRGQGRILAILKMKPEISQKEITYLLDMSKQSVAEILSKLERSGFIMREPSEVDRRVSVVKLTEEGAAAAEKMEEEPQKMTGMLDCLTDQELETLNGYLKRILKEHGKHFRDNEDFSERRRAMENFMREGRRPFDDRRTFSQAREDIDEDWSAFNLGVAFGDGKYREEDDE